MGKKLKIYLSVCALALSADARGRVWAATKYRCRPAASSPSRKSTRHADRSGQDQGWGAGSQFGSGNLCRSHRDAILRRNPLLRPAFLPDREERRRGQIPLRECSCRLLHHCHADRRWLGAVIRRLWLHPGTGADPAWSIHRYRGYHLERIKKLPGHLPGSFFYRQSQATGPLPSRPHPRSSWC